MAFVYRNGRENAPLIMNTPGPGLYHQSFQKEQANNSAVTFFDKCPRNLWKTSDTPGPGEYVVEKGNSFEKILSDQNFLVQYQNGQPSSSFKSQSKRMASGQPQTPGPGEYQFPKERNGGKRLVVSAKPTRLSRYLYEQNRKIVYKGMKKQGKKQCMIGKGGQENKNRSLSSDKNQMSEKKCTNAFSSKVQRKINMRPQTPNAVGPGSYNIAESYKFIDRKPSALKKQGIKDQSCRQGATIFAINKLNESIQSQQLNQKDEFKQNLGPGHYEAQYKTFIRNTPSVSKGIACFGSKQSRFSTSSTKSYRKVPGPQTYKIEASSNKQQKSDLVKKKVPFNCGTSKSLQYTISTVGSLRNVSPCSYNPRNDFRQLMKKNYKKGIIGQFGSTVERFKRNDRQQDKNKKKQALLKLYEEKEKQKKQKLQINFNKMKKHSRPRPEVQPLQEDPKPLCYDSDYNTIAKKNSIKIQQDAPFLIASERFRTTEEFNLQMELLEAIRSLQERKINIKGESKQVQKKQSERQQLRSPSALSKFFKVVRENNRSQRNQNRLDNGKKQSSNVGPQTYDPILPTKNKSYNVLFNNQSQR